MQNESVTRRMHLNLGSAALNALTIGKQVRLSLCPKSSWAVAVFRLIGDDAKPNYSHPVIEEILKQAAAESKHVTCEGNKLLLK